jgi:hypothetical protein
MSYIRCVEIDRIENGCSGKSLGTGMHVRLPQIFVLQVSDSKSHESHRHMPYRRKRRRKECATLLVDFVK